MLTTNQPELSVLPQGGSLGSIVLKDHEFSQFRDLIYRIAGISMSSAKKPLVTSRLAKRVKHYGFANYGPPVCPHRSSVDVLFRSIAKCAGKNALGIIMTGMGDDGARGMKEMHGMSSYTLAQDEDSCVVYGMPKEVVKLGAVDRVVPLTAIPASILSINLQKMNTNTFNLYDR